MKKLILLGAMVALCGCSRTIWIKNGASQAEFEVMKADCLVEGFQKIPSDERVIQVANGGYQTVKECAYGKRGEYCEKTTEYVPPRYASYDNNEDVRNQVVRACFYRSGWNEVEVK